VACHGEAGSEDGRTQSRKSNLKEKAVPLKASRAIEHEGHKVTQRGNSIFFESG
jgi:hypothetical protein